MILLLAVVSLTRGSDGRTYSNVGILDLVSCLTRRYIQPVNDNTGKM